jgi:predicted nucleic acid-binding protein
MTVIDSSGWIEYFAGTSKGSAIGGMLGSEAATPSIALAEIARKYRREGAQPSQVRKRLIFIEANSKIVDIDAEMAIDSARAFEELSEKAKREGIRSASLTDAIVLATARRLKARLITTDRHFKGLSETHYIGE